jgi:predicted ABC-type ATPase
MSEISQESKELVQQKFFAKVRKNCKEPFVYAMAGVPGAGKTTFVDKAIKDGVFPRDAFILNPDMVMEALPEYQQDVIEEGQAAAFTRWELPARLFAYDMATQAAENKSHIIKDMGCARQENLDMLKAFKDQGYKIVLNHIQCDPEIAHSRVADRARHTSKEMIAARYESILNLLPELKDVSDVYHSFENSEEGQPFAEI